ncbi:RING finger protein [Rutstroemia sp. NJR-2017a BVV2]|nr:RING finger protein [Rutstroemia sp. NJR-2017a BVV2]
MGKEVIKVGRYSERDNQAPQTPNVPSSAPVGFKSKVVSRRHCEFWFSDGRWFIKDVKSSSGTFLNHIRLSQPGTESRPYPVNDGDIVQLGIDFKGGEEMIFRCVKIRVELNKGWQTGPSSFNVADLEAELDDPDGEWEEYLASDAELEVEAQPEPPTKVTPANTTDASSEDLAVSAHQQDSINATAAGTMEAGRTLEPEIPRQRNAPQSDEELDVSDASSTSAQVHEDMAFLAVADSPPLSASATPIPRVNNSTIPPLDIIPRKPVPSSASGSSSRAEQGRGSPSPNGLRPALTDPLTGEGPMTPRNDAGPFVFDGSAGRASGVRLALGLADLNTETAVQSPATPQVTPQTAS